MEFPGKAGGLPWLRVVRVLVGKGCLRTRRLTCLGRQVVEHAFAQLIDRYRNQNGFPLNFVVV
jgi:hypothetical protein